MAVWSYTPQTVLAEEVVVHTHVTQITPASAITGQFTLNTQRIFRLRYTIIDTPTANSMAAFFDAQQGPFKAFDYPHIGDGTTYRVRFDQPLSLDLFNVGWLNTNEVTLVSQVGS